MFHTKQPIRFKCTACGQCCYGDKNAYIKLNRCEAEAITRQLGITPAWFKQNYLVTLPEGGNGIRIKDNGACSLLGNDGRCRVYSARPMQCRTYPYWPEILFNKSTWLSEKKRCEGINQGDIIDAEFINKQLDLSTMADEEDY